MDRAQPKPQDNETPTDLFYKQYNQGVRRFRHARHGWGDIELHDSRTDEYSVILYTDDGDFHVVAIAELS